MSQPQFRYLLRLDGVEFEVAKAATPKLEGGDGARSQKVDFRSGNPVWQMDLTLFNTAEQTSTTLTVTVVSAHQPPFTWREPVMIDELEMTPWAQRSRTGDVSKGVAFRVGGLRRIDEPASMAA